MIIRSPGTTGTCTRESLCERIFTHVVARAYVHLFSFGHTVPCPFPGSVKV